MSISMKLRVLPLALMLALGSAQAQDVPRDRETNATQVPPAASDDGISADVFYHLLLGDVALQRGEPGISARAFLEAARATQDPLLARRATEVAIVARQRGVAQDAAKLWSSLDPSAERPKQILAALAAGTSDKDLPSVGATDELRGRLEKLLADSAVNGNGVGEVFMQLNRLFAQQTDKRAVYQLLHDLAQPYPKSPEAHFAVALAAFTASGSDDSLAPVAKAEAEKVLELRPDWERGALLYSEIIGRNSPEEATAYLEKFVKAQPGSKAATGALAQQYVEAKRYTEARALMQKLWDREPESRELEFGVAAIAIQMKDYPEAERLLTDLDKAGYGEPGAMQYFLAQVAEERKQYDEALKRYQGITDGERAWPAKLRIGAMYAKLKRDDEAQKWFASLQPSSAEERIQLRQAQAQLLRDAGEDSAAYDVLDKALDQDPDSTDLIYDLAMVAEKLNRVEETEKRLRQLIELKPDDPQALNALGYTLVDRTDRTAEGYELIEKAHRLAPRDPFILDSLGWALFRMGRLDEAEGYLKRALDQRPDAEIAAHLGEVLWKKGDRARARAVWQAQIENNPDNEVLKETMRRLSR